MAGKRARGRGRVSNEKKRAGMMAVVTQKYAHPRKTPLVICKTGGVISAIRSDKIRRQRRPTSTPASTMPAATTLPNATNNDDGMSNKMENSTDHNPATPLHQRQRQRQLGRSSPPPPSPCPPSHPLCTPTHHHPKLLKQYQRSTTTTLPLPACLPLHHEMNAWPMVNMTKASNK